MNGYVCFWQGKQCEVNADTSYAAQLLATIEFKKIAGRKKVNGYDITVVLAEKNGQQVTHNPSM